MARSSGASLPLLKAMGAMDITIRGPLGPPDGRLPGDRGLLLHSQRNFVMGAARAVLLRARGVPGYVSEGGRGEPALGAPTIMTAVVFYDLEMVSAELRAASREKLGQGPLVEVAFGDAAVAEAEPASGAVERVRGPRDRVTLDAAYEWVTRLTAALRDRRPRMWQVAGLDLFRACEIILASELRHDLCRWTSLCEIRRRYAPTDVLWVHRAESLWQRRSVGCFADAAKREGERWALSAQGDVSVFREGKQRVHQAVFPFLEWARLPRNEERPVGRRREGRPLVLFSDYFPSNLSASLPVYERLRSAGELEVEWLAGRPSVAEALRERGTKSVALETFAAGRALTESARAVQAAWDVKKGLSELRLEDLGLNEEDSGVRVYLELAANHAFSKLRPFGGRAAQRLDSALQSLRPAVTVSTNHSSVYDRLFALAGHRAGAASVYVQHGLLAAGRVNGSFVQEHPLFWGEREIENLGRFGGDISRARAVGSPRHSSLRSGEPVPGVLSGPPRVLMFPSRTGGMVVNASVARRALESTFAATSAMDGATLTVKVHPGDHTGLAEQMMAGRERVHVTRTGSVSDLVRASDVVVVMSSTTGYDACALGRPLIVWGGQMFDDGDYLRSRAALSAETPEALRAAIERCAQDPETQESLRNGRERFRQHALCATGEDAAAAVARLITELALGDGGSGA